MQRRAGRWVGLAVVPYAAMLVAAACTGEDPPFTTETHLDAGGGSSPDTGIDSASVDAADAGCGADFATSKEHCGRCMHGCLGGDCQGGACQPVVLATEDAGLELTALGVHAGAVYWSAVSAGVRADVRRCDVANCAATTTTIAFAGDGGYFPVETRTTGIAGDDAHVYFTSYFIGKVFRCAAAGCGDAGPEAFASTGGSPDQIVVVGTDVFWANVGAGDSIQSCSTNGCGDGGPRTLTSTKTDAGRPLFPSFVIANEYAYFTSYQRGDAAPDISLDYAPGIYRVLENADHAPPENIARMLVKPQAVAVVGSAIFFTDQRESLTKGALLRTTVASGLVSEHATDLVEPTSLIADGNTLYFIEHGAGKIRQCTSASCATPTTVASEQGDPQGLTQDAVSLYWYNGTTNQVMRVAK